jgi:hypothetical protein
MAEPRVTPFNVPGSLTPDCENCPRGAGLSLTVFFYGIGERSFLSTTVRYSREESMFPRALAEALARGPHECCRVEMMIVKHDPSGTIAENATAVAAAINQATDAAVAGYPWLTKINLHLVGFSAGGLLAVDTASRVDLRTRVRDAEWCGHRMPREVPVEMDLVTMATPFNLEFFGAGTLTSGFPWTYESSVGASEYQAPAPGLLCSFTAFVSSSSHGDESRGADRDPGTDQRLDAMLSGLNAAQRHVVPLSDAYRPVDPDDPDDPARVSHLQVPERILADFSWALVPRCDCV